MSVMIAEVYEAFRETGVAEDKARAAATAIADFREDISGLKSSLQGTEARLKGEIEKMRQETKTDIAQAKAEILKWMFAALLGQTAIITALVKLL
jgi:predicted  nucleic acid-binding Zn-ribbon protein